ncbi:hypothetical protein N7490_009276 [Penicillium lividum]|nr:hypothetical protein N7490_009276 [Penicillium lividum]
MIHSSQADQGPSPESSGTEPRRSGSVKRARQLLEAGVRPTQAAPPVPRPAPPPPVRKAAHQTQWPLPASGLEPQPLNPQHPRFMAPRGPPPLRPPRPSEMPMQIPSPSIYSVRSGEGSAPSVALYANPYPYPTRGARSFSLPNPHNQLQPPRPLTSDGSTSPTSTLDGTSGMSITTDDLFRHSTYSLSSSSGLTLVPPREPPLPPAQPRRPPAGLNVIPAGARRSRARASSVSPIIEEIPDPRHTLGSLASSRAMPHSWGSGPGESEILEGYLDDESSEAEEEEETRGNEHEEEANPVRSVSVGKRQRPTMRTIMKSNPPSEVSIPDMPGITIVRTAEESSRAVAAGTAATGKLRVMNATPTQIRTPSPVLRGSISSLSGESCVDPEKPRFARQDDNTYRGALEKELEGLPLAAPTLSDKRPNGRKPPRLDMNAVRDAESRGSLSSLSDLIRRATRLASNLDHGKTASRSDLVGAGADFRQLGHRARNSGSLSDILASFPNPTPDGHSSWPVFFGRSNLRNVEPLASHDDVPEAPKAKRQCCGMPRKWFIILCIAIFIVIVLAILLPVFLVAVPKENAADKSCAHTTPCHNGGVSVSSGSDCSCVCSEGYMGVQCIILGDSTCVSAEVDNGSISKNATMGSSIPTLLDQSDSKFGIELDAITIMALFSMSNVTCQTENELVAFSKVERSSSSDNARRAIALPVENDTETSDIHDETTNETPSLLGGSTGVSHVIYARATATSNGIYYDSGNAKSASSETDSTATTTSSPTATGTGTTSTASATATATSVPSGVVEFSQVAVLYILEKTGSFDLAQQSESEIQTYLIDEYNSAAHPAVEILGWYGLDFANKTITTG